jgi:GH24 family phage-related lysozyme (muramidase)
MVNEDQVLIPAEIRSMARLWANEPGMAGLVIRRNLEAALFEKGLKST